MALAWLHSRSRCGAPALTLHQGPEARGYAPAPLGAEVAGQRAAQLRRVGVLARRRELPLDCAGQLLVRTPREAADASPCAAGSSSGHVPQLRWLAAPEAQPRARTEGRSERAVVHADVVDERLPGEELPVAQLPEVGAVRVLLTPGDTQRVRQPLQLPSPVGQRVALLQLGLVLASEARQAARLRGAPQRGGHGRPWRRPASFGEAVAGGPQPEAPDEPNAKPALHRVEDLAAP